MNIYSLSSLIASIFCIALGSFVYLTKGRSKRRRLFAFASVLTGLWTLFPFVLSRAPDEQVALLFARLTYIPAVFTPTVWLHFMLSITGGKRVNQERRALILSYTMSVLFLSLCFNPSFIKGVNRFAPHFSVIPGPLYIIFIFCFTVIFVYILSGIFRSFWIAYGYVRNQLKYIMLSYMFGFFSGILHFGAAYFNREPVPHDFLLIVYTALIWYAIFQYKLMNIEHAIAMIMTFGVVCIPIVATPFVIGYFTQSWILCGVFATVLTPIGFHLYTRVKRKIITERLIFQDAAIEIIDDIKHIRTFDKLFKTIANHMIRKLKLTYVGLYWLDAKNNQYILEANENDKSVEPKITVRRAINADETLIRLLLREKEPIVYEELKSRFYDTNLQILKEAQAHIKMINAAVVIPIFYQDEQEELVAIVVLGDKLSGKPYTTYDIKVLKSLAEHIALAIKNAEFIEDLNAAHTELLQARTKKHLADMADGMSHQFHNKFMVINAPLGFAKDLLSKIDFSSLSTRDKKKIEQILDAMDRAEKHSTEGGEIARALLNFTRPDREGYKMLDVSQEIGMVLRMVEYKHPDFSEIKITKNIEPNLPLTWAHSAYLKDIYFIVIDNAYDAIRYKMNDKPAFKGEIAISVSNDKEKNNIQIVIKDNGTGMTKEVLEKVKAFVPYMTTKATSEKSGYGAGIQVLRRLVEFHNGRINYDSIDGEGTTVTITIPVTKNPKEKRSG